MRLFIEFQEKYKLTTFCAQKLFLFCFCFHIQNNICTQHVVNLYFSWNSMNNLSSFCGLTDSRMRDLPVSLQKSKKSSKLELKGFKLESSSLKKFGIELRNSSSDQKAYFCNSKTNRQQFQNKMYYVPSYYVYLPLIKRLAMTLGSLKKFNLLLLVDSITCSAVITLSGEHPNMTSDVFGLFLTYLVYSNRLCPKKQRKF